MLRDGFGHCIAGHNLPYRGEADIRVTDGAGNLQDLPQDRFTVARR
jgi:hypothetical protein